MGVGMASSFALIGLLVGTLGDAIGLTGDGVRSAGGVLLLLFGLVMLVPALDARFSQFMTPLATSAQSAGSRLNSASLLGALGLGGLLGLVWSPCSGPLLGSALALVASEGGAGRGALILGLFGIGAAVPLVAASLCVACWLWPRARLGDRALAQCQTDFWHRDAGAWVGDPDWL